ISANESLSDADGEPPSASPGPPPHIPDYDLSHPIGSGGFGQVWLGRNRHTGQWYAVKVIPVSHAMELDGIRRYKRRAQGHPNLMPIEHVGFTPKHDFIYYTMPLADEAKGSTPVAELRDYEPMTLQRILLSHLAPLPVDEVLTIAGQLLAALEHLHAAR